MAQKIGNWIQKINTAQMMALSFAGIILLGSLILRLPFCTVPGEHTSYIDALFTATTCVCVTGLVTVTTAVHWTLIGKIVILILIQAGGIGLISLASIIFITLHKKISLRNRKMIQESYNLDQMSGLVKVVRRVIFCVFGAEAAGALCYSLRFVPQFGLRRGIGQSVFTAVSAFCNAGMDVLGENSLAPYVSDPIVNFTTMGLIIVSGLGFVVWWDLADKIRKVWRGQLSLKRMYKSLRLQTKLVLTMTGILVLGGTFLIFLFEYKNPDTMGSLPVGSKLMASAFQSVTTRTAGFFTVDQAGLSDASFLLCLVLMFIGGSPMGTAGGVKTTTIAVLVLTMITALKGRTDVEFAGRRIRVHYIRSAIVVTGASFMVLFVMCLFVSFVMPQAGLYDILYELTSAVGTVGLSRGLTPDLNFAGKCAVILTMYLGRIGPLTLGTAVLLRSQKRPESMHLAAEDMMIG